MALVVALQQSSFVRLCSWPALTRRHCARVSKWRARVVHAKYSTRASKIPTLMRYIPKEARKTDGEKLESVHFPSEHLRSHEDSGEEGEEYNAEDSDFDFNSQSYASEDLPTWKSAKFAYDQSRSQPEVALSRKTYQENMQSQFPAEASLKPWSENRSHTVSVQSWNPGGEHVRKDEGERINRPEPENDPTAKPHQKELQSVAAFEATRETGLKVNTQPDMWNCRTEHVSESEAEEIELFESEKAPSRNTYQKDLRSRFPALELVPASEVTPRSRIVSRKAKIQAETLNHRAEHPSKNEVEEEEMEEFVSRHDSEEESQDENLITTVNLEEDESLIPEKNRELSASDNPGERSAAKNYAIFLLGKGQKTAAELKKKLRDKNYSSQVIDSTISDLRSSGLQSDTSYADVFTQSRWNARGWGPKRIKHELLQKGVDVRNIDRALMHVFKEDCSGKTMEESEESRWDMSKPAEEHLLALAARKWKSGGNISEEARKRRLAGWLQRRGFSWKVITGVIGTLQGKRLLPFDEDPDE